MRIEPEIEKKARAEFEKLRDEIEHLSVESVTERIHQIMLLIETKELELLPPPLRERFDKTTKARLEVSFQKMAAESPEWAKILRSNMDFPDEL